MKKIYVLFLATFGLFLSVVDNHALAAGLFPAPAKGERLPVIRLPAPADPRERMYLGLSGNGNFKISQIEAKAVIINLFNLYCPSCQGMVQEMAKLYHRIENNPDLKNRVKLMGIGIGNSLHEVKVFTETYQLPFPIFPDEDFKIHKLFGEVRTPYLIGIEIDKNDRHRIVYTQRGGITEAESFLHLILEVYGFKQEDPPLRREDLSITLIN